MFANLAPTQVRERGAAYQREGRVRITGMDGKSVITARVRGTRNYSVEIDVRPVRGGLRFGCSCPFGQDGELCKHVWATAVEIDESILGEMNKSIMAPPPRKVAQRGMAHELDGYDEDDEEFDEDDEEFDEDEDDEEFDEDEEFELDERGQEHGRGQLGALYPRFGAATTRAPLERLHQMGLLDGVSHPALARLVNPAVQDWYLIDLFSDSGYYAGNAIILHAARRSARRNGELGPPTAVDRPPKSGRPQGVEGVVWGIARTQGLAVIHADLVHDVLKELSQKGRLGAVPGMHRKDEVKVLRWDADQPHRVVLRVGPAKASRVPVELFLRRVDTDEELPLRELDATLACDFVVAGERLLRLAPTHARWVEALYSEPLTLTKSELAELAKRLARVAGAPLLEGAGGTVTEPRQLPLRALLRFETPSKAAKLARGVLHFGYGVHEVSFDADNPVEAGSAITRDLDGETAIIVQLQQLGVSVETSLTRESRHFVVKFELAELARIVPPLLDLGFVVEVEGKPYRRSGVFTPIIESGQDWFELAAQVDFEGQVVTLPELLRAVRNRQQWVRLRDGSLGALPQEWLDSLTELAALAPPRGNTLRFHPIVARLVEGLLQGAANPLTDSGFAALKQRFASFEAIQPVDPPAGFNGELRDYQRVALGWLAALDELGFGGCLADDMGLGKTVIVLAWLLQRVESAANAAAGVSGKPNGAKARSARAASRKSKVGQTRAAAAQLPPSLLVVPKSLLFNWQRESARFTPSLRVLIHHGNERLAPGAHFSNYDVVLTSYGTLRRDASELAQQQFDYVVLDEAHGIKNSSSESHAAARALSSRRRLALTGTPVENHLGELWSLLSYLNPDVMGGLAHLQKVFAGRRLRTSAVEAGVPRAISPFILRRTKAEVAKELPDRIEKTIEVELSTPERKRYDELARYYRSRLLERREASKQAKRAGGPGSGDGGRQMAEALEGLLRLRQAACHSGLLDDQYSSASSAKFDVLLERVAALRDEGHKVLVFSQFTKLLHLLEPHLRAAGIGYAYLDGKTADRAKVVDQFTNDPNITAFLISLKAGGVGLNLIAADYVFLLDPWWNPASEAQAIDRAHRLGQHRTVVAYRLLCTGTVEDKVAALQADKRELVASLFGDEATFGAKFTREDLELLLS